MTACQRKENNTMKKNILICLDLIKHPFSGMGRVSSDFGSEISKTDAFNYTYLIPPKQEALFLNNKNTCELTGFRKLFSSYQKKYALCHVLHQLPKFSFRKARKVVLTIHDLNFRYTKSHTKQKKYQRIVQSAVNKADYICFISEFTKNDCFQFLQIPANTKTAVIYNGVNDLPAPSLAPEWCPNDEFLFSIGQFLSKKNFHVLIPLLLNLPNNISLIIAGQNNTKYGDEIRDLITQYHLETRVILPGAISEGVKSYLYHNCKAFVFPSIAEGFGLPVIEAMRCEKPVFCSDKTSLKEIGNRFAFFWDNFDPEYMTNVFNNGMDFVYNNELFIKDQLKYSKSFTWKKNVEDYLDIYRQLL